MTSEQATNNIDIEQELLKEISDITKQINLYNKSMDAKDIKK